MIKLQTVKIGQHIQQTMWLTNGSIVIISVYNHTNATRSADISWPLES